MFYLILCIHIIFSFVFITIYCDVTEQVFRKDADRRYTNVSQTVGASSVLSCGRVCLRKDWCKIFSYNSLDQICELGYLTPGNSVQTDQEDGWQTYIDAVDDCKSSPCMNSGSCTDYIGYYECRCVDGWGGTNCDTIVGCVSGTQMFGNSCYFIDESTRSQVDAQVNCNTFFSSAHLVDIKSEEEQEFIIGYISSSDLDEILWIGAKYNASSQHYFWTDGSPLSYGFWGQGEPTSLSEECVVLYAPFGYMWADITCSYLFASICEYDLP